MDSLNNYLAFQVLLADFAVATYTKSDFNIVLALIECLNKDGSVPGIEEVAEQACTSVSTISRFTKKLGFKDYQSFRYKLSNIGELVNLKRKAMYCDNPELIKEAIQENLKATWDNIDYDKLKKIIDILKTSKKNLFVGTSDSLMTFFGVYKDLFFSESTNYFFLDLKTQLDFVKRLDKGDCIVVVSCIPSSASMYTKPMLEKLKKKGVKIIMFSQNISEDKEKLCEVVYKYGRPDDMFIGIHSLEYLGYVMSGIIRNEKQ